MSKYTEYGKNVQVKNEQIKMILMNHGKPELSDRLSAFHSTHIYEELIFRLQTLREY